MNDPSTDQEGSRGDRWDEKLARLVWWGRPAAATLGERTRRRGMDSFAADPVRALHPGVHRSLEYFDCRIRHESSPADGGLGFNSEIVGFGAGVFFWGYWILEIPSTLAVERRGARRVFCRILVLWGLCAVLMGFMGMPLMRTMFDWLPQFTRAESWPLVGAAAQALECARVEPGKSVLFLAVHARIL